jgi:hypothetical protein
MQAQEHSVYDNEAITPQHPHSAPQSVSSPIARKRPASNQGNCAAARPGVLCEKTARLPIAPCHLIPNETMADDIICFFSSPLCFHTFKANRNLYTSCILYSPRLHFDSLIKISLKIKIATAGNWKLQHAMTNILSHKTKLRGLNPRANYINRTNVACQRS